MGIDKKIHSNNTSNVFKNNKILNVEIFFIKISFKIFEKY